MMYSTKAIANYFVQRGLQSGRLVDPMKLQKLIYFAHGWHLAIYDEPLIDEKVEAWSYGPVAPSIYHAVKSHGSSPIDFPIFQLGNAGMEPPAVQDQQTRELLERVWEVYGEFSSVELSRMSHDPEGPWYATWQREARGGTIRNVDIPDERIREYFIGIAQRESIPSS